MEGNVPRMTQRTFDDATAWPALNGNSLRLYSMRFCPYAQRARLVLAHKNILHETVNVHLKRKPSWLLERNPKGRVPVLEHPDGRIIFESIVVCQYLDEIFPYDRLTPTDSYRKARDRLLVDYCDKFMMATYQLLFTDGTSEEEKATIQKGLSIYEKEFNKRLPDGPFFGGNKPAMADYLIWPWIERLPMFDDYTATSTNATPPTNTLEIGVTSSTYPRVYHWMEAMFQLPAVKETMFDLRSHGRFGRSQLTADPEYDMGLENEPPLPSVSKL
ncbi:hypothetical protein V1264_000849 [Littorina saxatilis]